MFSKPVASLSSKLNRTGERLTLSLPRVIKFKFPLQPHQKHFITQYEKLGFSWLTEMKDDYATNFRYLTHTLLLKRLGECSF